MSLAAAVVVVAVVVAVAAAAAAAADTDAGFFAQLTAPDHFRSPVQKSEKQIAHLSRNWKNIAHLIVTYIKIEKNRSRVSKSEKISSLHPAGRFQLQFVSLRSTTI